MATIRLPWTTEAHPGRRGGTPWLAQIVTGEPFAFIKGEHNAVTRTSAWSDLGPGFYTAGNVAGAPDGRMWLRIDPERGARTEQYGATRPPHFPTPGSTGRTGKRRPPITPKPDAPVVFDPFEIARHLAAIAIFQADAIAALDALPAPASTVVAVTAHLDDIAFHLGALRRALGPLPAVPGTPPVDGDTFELVDAPF